MRLKFSIAVLSLIFNITDTSFSQDRLTGGNGCTLLDHSRPPQIIVYEDRFESEIHLRLRNNTSCKIIVETDDVYPTELKKLPQGGVKIESILGSRDGIKLRLHYLIQTKRDGGLKPAYGWGDSVFTYEIPAGQSITFSVPERHFKRRYNIAVPFGYSWEGNNSIGIGVGGVVHRVYFLSEDLPLR
ncbi:MAG TPA: hypothetical protein VFM05_04695 [Candidatus Saccharimonadales bacterium]|nr:hypothetical protein [Candidatus Saccharimonadales bacterium]